MWDISRSTVVHIIQDGGFWPVSQSRVSVCSKQCAAQHGCLSQVSPTCVFNVSYRRFDAKHTHSCLTTVHLCQQWIRTCIKLCTQTHRTQNDDDDVNMFIWLTIIHAAETGNVTTWYSSTCQQLITTQPCTFWYGTLCQ